MIAFRLFARIFAVEWLKLKRTLALAMIVLAPLAIVILHGLIGYAGGSNFVRGGRPAWPQLVNNGVGMWTLLLMPLFITLETALLAGLEHHGNWKSALTLPAPRWMIYAAKLMTAVVLLWAAHAVLACGLYAAAVILRSIQPALALTELPLTPLVRPIAVISVTSLLALTIQHWISLRWQSFTTPIGFGMFAMISGFVAANSMEWGRRWPWSLPLHAVRPTAAGELDLVTVSLIGAFIVGIAGCIEFSRREIA